MEYKTLFDKIWDDHVVTTLNDGRDILYIDRHLIHEVTSPQAFEELELKSRVVRRPQANFAVCDHNVPTDNINLDFSSESGIQVNTLKANCSKHNIQYFDLGDKKQGIVHVIGPELGITQPGITLVCGDSHTTTHGAFGALAFGIGTSEIEHVLSTQTIVLKRPKNFLVKFINALPDYVSSKDLALYLIATIGADSGNGYAIEYQGDVVKNLSMEARMTLCNMAIEAGARFAIIQPDDKTFSYLQGRLYSPTGSLWNQGYQHWCSLFSDNENAFDRIITFDVSKTKPFVTWGTTLDMAISIDDNIPNTEKIEKSSQKQQIYKALEYMNLKPGTPIQGIKIDRAFIGSCTNSRLEDLQIAANIIKNKKVASHVNAIVVPGSMHVKHLAEQIGLDKIFIDAGFSWRNSGCSMCIGMNEDKLLSAERCASTSNRNFEGRQGRGGRTHIMSPAMVAAAAIAGKIIDIREVL